MYTKRFQGDTISALGFGALRLPAESSGHVDRKLAWELIDAAIGGGINYFDTAYTYLNGESEQVLGEALRRYPRDSYYLATKFYVAASTDIKAVFEEQLRRCQTEYFDFYLLHGLQEQYIDAYMDQDKRYLEYLLDRKEKGYIRHIGFSSHAAPDTLSRFLDWYDGFEMALIQLNYVDWVVQKGQEQYEILAKHGIPIWVMEPLKGGRLAELTPRSEQILRAAAPGRSIASWGFRYLMSLPNVQTVLSGMSSLGQVKDNLATFQAWDPLDEGQRQALQAARDIFIAEMGIPCSACRYCTSHCPAGMDIPTLIRGYNERRLSNDGSTWRMGQLQGIKGPESCIQCGSCAKYCPQKIDIPGVMRAFSALLE